MFPVRSYVALTGEEVTQGSDRFLVTREPDVLVSAADATVVRAATKAPFERSGGDGKREGSGRQTWLDVSISRAAGSWRTQADARVRYAHLAGPEARSPCRGAPCALDGLDACGALSDSTGSS